MGERYDHQRVAFNSCFVSGWHGRCGYLQNMNRVFNKDFCFVGFKKGDENYLYIFREDQAKEISREIGKDAANNQLSLSWSEACKLVMKVKELCDKTS